MPRRPRHSKPRAAPEGSDDGILDLLHLDPADELEHKRERVERALRARGLEHAVPTPLASPRRHGARARVSLRTGRGGALVVRRPGSHDDVAPPLDAMARPVIVAVASALQERLGAEPSLARGVERLELRSDGARVVTVLYGEVPRRAREPLAALLAPALGPGGALCLQARTLRGDGRLRIAIADGLVLEVGPLGFYQVNLEGNHALVASVRAMVAGLAPTRVLDLFGGAGNLSLPIAADGAPVELVESHPSAVKDAKANVARTGLPITVAQEDAYRLEAGSRFFDVAVLDPPRRGAGPAMEAVCATRPRGIVLVSCHPTSLARDLQLAEAQGYQLAQLELHDLFPLTSHVESVALLTRR